MNPNCWEAVGELFEKALSLPTGARTAYIERESENDDELRREVLSLIASHNVAKGGFVQERIKNAVLSPTGTRGTQNNSRGAIPPCPRVGTRRHGNGLSGRARRR